MCHDVCDKCYNGGVCDDKTGNCICPPGFKGQNCLTGTLNNRILLQYFDDIIITCLKITRTIQKNSEYLKNEIEKKKQKPNARLHLHTHANPTHSPKKSSVF